MLGAGKELIVSFYQRNGVTDYVSGDGEVTFATFDNSSMVMLAYREYLCRSYQLSH
jgi:hypothetical protein